MGRSKIRPAFTLAPLSPHGIVDGALVEEDDIGVYEGVLSIEVCNGEHCMILHSTW
jgi:hypothetical protein